MPETQAPRLFMLRGAPVNHNPSNRIHIHHQDDNTQGEQGLIQDGADGGQSGT